jgi:hypothetical protein
MTRWRKGEEQVARLITADEAKDAIETANRCVSSADRLLQLDELGIF